MHEHIFKCDRVAKIANPRTHEVARVAMFSCVKPGCRAYKERPALDIRESMKILEDYRSR